MGLIAFMARKSAPAAGDVAGLPAEAPPPPVTEEQAEKLKELAAKDPRERTAAETLAASRGAMAEKRAELAELEKRIAESPAVAREPHTIALLKKRALDPEVYRDAQRVIAGLEGELAADLLLAIWTGTPGRSDATALAEALVQSKDVRAKASAAVGLSVDLRSAKECEQRKALVQKALTESDQRSLQPLAALRSKVGCGPTKREDCNPCLRDDDSLEEAIKAATKRPPPKL
jgi:hypothetical protein